MGIQEIAVSTRSKTGKGEAGRLRRSGSIPAVVYGLGGESVPVTVTPKNIAKVLKSEKGMNSVILLKDEASDRSRHVMIKEVTRHPVTDRMVHVDFIRLDMEKIIRVVVPVNLNGVPEGVKLGGILSHIRHELEVEALPANLPASLEADVSGLGLDEALRVSQIPLPDGVTMITEQKRTVAVVHLEEAAVDDDAEEEVEAVAEEVEA